MTSIFIKNTKVDKVNIMPTKELLQANKLIDAFGSMTKESFLGKPKITKDSNASDLMPRAPINEAEREFVPFMQNSKGSKFAAKFSATGCTVYDRENNDRLVASYANYGAGTSTLVVDKKYRRQGIGSEMIFQWRLENPAAELADTRTKKSQALQESVWMRLQSELRGARSVVAADVASQAINSSTQSAPAQLRKSRPA